ncbi:MAG: hypothetical protein U5L95_02610 [Candidatus Saccharibacteria bacterium]|nr:hypothetical protein [Candidatus Saccharibacteria bacterium]
MDEEKNCCDDGCKCQEEEPQYIPPYMLQGNGIVSNRGSFNVGIDEPMSEPASPLKIDKILI